MKTYCYFAGIMLLCISCVYQSHIKIPPITTRVDQPVPCEAIYPQGKWQFVHSISFSTADGKEGTAIGVTVIDDPIIQSALITPEGLTLFEAEYNGQLEITRALPPFDSINFGEGLIEDLQLIFFKPSTNNIHYGKLADGSPLCRYIEPSGQTTDVVLSQDQGWEIHQYSPDQLRRVLKAHTPESQDSKFPNNWLPPDQMDLQAYGTMDYTLKIKLVSSEKLWNEI